MTMKNQFYYCDNPNCENIIDLYRYVMYDHKLFCCEECVEQWLENKGGGKGGGK